LGGKIIVKELATLAKPAQPCQELRNRDIKSADEGIQNKRPQ